MKKILKILVILFLGIISVSCEDFLEPEPNSAILKEDFYTSSEDLETALVSIYDAIQGVNTTNLRDNRGIQIEFYLTEMYSDNTSTSSVEAGDSSDAGQFENYSLQETNGISANYYSSMYRVIYLANVVLDNISVVENETTSLRIEGEAKFLRAYAYFNLIRLFGEDTEDLGVPLIDHILSEEESDLEFLRASEDAVYDLIISDLVKATEGLDDSYKTRASKSAAHTLLAKVYMTIDEPNYSLAATNLLEVIGKYELEPLDEIFGISNELNDEIIFAIGFENNSSDDSQNYSAEFNDDGNTSGVNYLTDDLNTRLANNEGVQIDQRLSFVQEVDERFRTSKHISTSEWGRNNQFEEGGCDWIVLRYADVIMLLAEAEIGASGASIDDVTTTVWGTEYNYIRTRAGLTAIESLSKNELLTERRFEFFTENKRLFDLKRFGVADQVLSNYALSQGFNFNTNELSMPIPLREINLSPVVNGEHILVQNIAWR